MIGVPCTENGDTLPPNIPPPPLDHASTNDWTPFRSCIEFEFANFAFCHNQMSASNLDELLDIWAASLFQHGNSPPFADYKDMYETIDDNPYRDV